MWDGPKGLDTADMVQGSLLSTKGAMVFTPQVYKHQLQAHTAVGSWALSTTELSFLGKGNWPGGDTAQAARHSTLAPAGSSVGSEGPLPAHSRGHVGPGALAKMKEKQDKGKPKPGAAVRNLNLHTELIHSAEIHS